MKRSRWQCLGTKQCFYLISDNEMNQRLAETWEILLALKGQPLFRQNHSIIDTVENLSNSNAGRTV